MQLVDPEEIPAVERLTQEVLVLREKVAVAESRGQEATGNRRQQVMCPAGQACMYLCFFWCSVIMLYSQLLDMLRCACSLKLAAYNRGNTKDWFPSFVSRA